MSPNPMVVSITLSTSVVEDGGLLMVRKRVALLMTIDKKLSSHPPINLNMTKLSYQSGAQSNCLVKITYLHNSRQIGPTGS